MTIELHFQFWDLQETKYKMIKIKAAEAKKAECYIYQNFCFFHVGKIAILQCLAVGVRPTRGTKGLSDSRSNKLLFWCVDSFMAKSEPPHSFTGKTLTSLPLSEE